MNQENLDALRDEWRDCTRCSLSQQRQEVGATTVFGEGRPRGILFVGESPGKDEEAVGRPFVGTSGQLLREALKHLGINHYYLTNTVLCRSCGPAYSSEGQIILRRNYRTGAEEPIIQDLPPPPPALAACTSRLQQQIYAVDPLLIVSLGVEAAKALTGKNVSITSIRGFTQEISIPGRWHTAVLTEKRGVWARKVRGELVRPVTKNLVRYLLLPTLHPAYVLRSKDDTRADNPMQQFIDDLSRARDIYNRYHAEVFTEGMGAP